ncbi:DNA adenine methylase [Intestinimonas sp.]|uniref:DNA adenine methylase n=1 Tax=Intestinimonas sp. TaxID=1965293 RepID=UPI00261D55E8|nr:DNA adenine methylase [Intestinimonas sp.]
MQMYSPLRYPGGKSRLSKFIGQAICNLQIHNCTYIEPFAGGAGVALSLLLDGVVENIVINDYDKAIYSFWRALKQEPTALIEKIQSTPITIEEWHRQKEIYVCL